MKKNCWEVKDCGREPGGKHIHDLGVCAAATDDRFHGVHGGKAAGRVCWMVAGTLCGGQTQGTFAEKFGNCFKCDHYLAVRKDETSGFQHSFTPKNRLGRKTLR